ncbi:MAG: sulfatase-like hydrolase/transferase [Bryobacterales bacterium]|nr:sulfatase-like hydrolase/transferase [Bryobacterales bacterium]
MEPLRFRRPKRAGKHATPRGGSGEDGPGRDLPFLRLRLGERVQGAPLRLYKHYTYEGGISTPCIVHWPGGGVPAGGLRHEPAHLVDVMPTFLAAAGGSYPTEIRGQKALQLAGSSLLPLYKGASFERGPIFFEHESNRAVRIGRWKLVGLGSSGPWELYDMEADRAESEDLAAAEPERVRTMAAAWEEWARRDKAIPWPWQPQWGEAGQG